MALYIYTFYLFLKLVVSLSLQDFFLLTYDCNHLITYTIIFPELLTLMFTFQIVHTSRIWRFPVSFILSELLVLNDQKSDFAGLHENVTQIKLA